MGFKGFGFRGGLSAQQHRAKYEGPCIDLFSLNFSCLQDVYRFLSLVASAAF